MFGHRYFGAAYFGPSYWGPGQSVSQTDSGSPTTGAPRRWTGRWHISVKGKNYHFSTEDELETILSSFKAKTKKRTKQKLEKRVTKVEIPRVEADVQLPMWAVQEVQKVNASLEMHFWTEYQKILDEDEAVTLLLL